MKVLQKTFAALSLLTTAMLFAASCNSDDDFAGDDSQPDERVPHYATMRLNGGITGFDNTTRAGNGTAWEDGDKVYLQFSVGNELVDGAAIYDSETEEWEVQYYGTITLGTESKCEAFFFENAVSSTHTGVTLNEHSAIYCDKNATYLFEGSVLKVSANLAPVTGRIRFAGEISQDAYFSGIKYYTGYSITDNTLTVGEKRHSITVGDDGYTPYYYAFFPDSTKKEIFFDDIESGYTYSKVLGNQALATGRSGYLDIPTLDDRSGWDALDNKDFTVSNVTFRMIRVVPPSTYSIPSFWIAETETTQELWKAVMGSSSNPSTCTGTNMPVNNVSYDECQTFITKLNSKLGLGFRLPGANEWELAFKGGCKTKNYSYSGSDNYDLVAWHGGNSDSKPHPVKEKNCNEIGVYDMSGNVREWVNTTYILSGTTYGYCYGGCYDTYYHSGLWASDCYSNETSYKSSSIGFRLAY